MTNHADPIDKASELADAFTEHSIQAVQARNKPEQVKNPDGTWPHEECIECGDTLPLARKELGRVKCISCQEIFEKHTRSWR